MWASRTAPRSCRPTCCSPRRCRGSDQGAWRGVCGRWCGAAAAAAAAVRAWQQVRLVSSRTCPRSDAWRHAWEHADCKCWVS
jgi:hypothetical protein